jgi:hypothetical protein
MALNTKKLGGIMGHATPFPLKKKSTVSNNSKLLGQKYDLGDGLCAMLVQANAAVTDPAKKAFKWHDTDAYKVTVGTANTDALLGVAHPELEDLAASDYFFLIVPGNGGGGRATGIAQGSVTAGDYLGPSDSVDGSLVSTTTTRDSVDAGMTVGVALETVSDTEEVDFMFIQALPGVNA